MNPTDRIALRLGLHKVRDAFVATDAASAALGRHLQAVCRDLQPDVLGLYWPVRSEFNAASACLADKGLLETSLALPCSRRDPPGMVYRTWDRRPPTARDEFKVPCADGPPVVPGVVLAPCLGFTRAGLRIGYGGGFFDRWLAAHPHVTTVGVAWSVCEVDAAAEPHDIPMMLIVTEDGVIG